MKKIKKNTLTLTTTVSIILGLIILTVSFAFFSNNFQISSLLNLLALVVMIGIPLMYKYMAYTNVKKIEELFPKMLMSITQNINTGMTLPQAIKTVSKTDYGPLSPYVMEMHAKISFGVPFEKVLKTFADKIGSKTIKRNVHMIVETHRSGGTVATVLNMISESLIELEKVKRERASTIYAQMLNGYIIFFIFLGVMIGLSNFLIPTFQMDIMSETTDIFSELFRNLIIIEGLFAGLAIGKLSEGGFKAGIKHSLILMVLGFAVFVIFVPV